MSHLCPHVDAIHPVAAAADVCEACVAIGGSWVHLRQCRTCAATLCCDSSPNRHMSAHQRAAGHPIMRGADPGDDWTWCSIDDELIRETPDGWQSYDPYVAAGTQAASVHIAAGGMLGADPGLTTRTGFPLGDWTDYVRSLHAAGELDPFDASAIEALPGWSW